MIKLKYILNEAIKINAKTEDDLQKQLIKHGFGDYYNSSIAQGKKLKDMKILFVMLIMVDLILILSFGSTLKK